MINLDIPECRCPYCAQCYRLDYSEHSDGVQVRCGHCGKPAHRGDVLDARADELEEQRQDAIERRAEARREAAYERRRGVE